MSGAPCRLLIAAQPLEAGVPRHVLDLLRHVDPERFAVTVACPRESELWGWLDAMPHVRRRPIAGEREPALADAFDLARLVRLMHGADVVHAHSAKAGFLARLGARLRGHSRKCVFTPHGWSFWSADGGRARFYAGLERASARWCRTIVTVSEHERRAGVAMGIGRPEQYRVVHNGVDPERLARAPAPQAMRVLFVGRLAPPKRPDLVVHAMARLTRRFPGAVLQVAGDGPDRVALERTIGELGLRRRVELLGKRDDVPALLARATCMVLASDYEACPLSVLEAKAAAVPVIATAVGGIPEIVEHDVDGLLVKPGSVGGLAAAIATLLAHPQRARAMGDKGRRSVLARHTSAQMVQRITALYAEALQQPRASDVPRPAVDSP
jgi:glycosyltransferase involved in cell wall biosynthesis